MRSQVAYLLCEGIKGERSFRGPFSILLTLTGFASDFHHAHVDMDPYYEAPHWRKHFIFPMLFGILLLAIIIIMFVMAHSQVAAEHTPNVRHPRRFGAEEPVLWNIYMGSAVDSVASWVNMLVSVTNFSLPDLA